MILSFRADCEPDGLVNSDSTAQQCDDLKGDFNSFWKNSTKQFQELLCWSSQQDHCYLTF